VCFLCIALRRRVEATIPAMVVSDVTGCQGNNKRAPGRLDNTTKQQSCAGNAI